MSFQSTGDMSADGGKNGLKRSDAGVQAPNHTEDVTR